MVRKLNSEIKLYKCKWKTFLDSFGLDGDGEPIQQIALRAFNPLTVENEKFENENDYLLCFFGIYQFTSFSTAHIQKL
jgi:hypothetical protein